MAEDQAARVEWLEKAHMELQKKHVKSCNDIFQIMKMLKIPIRKKQSTETPNPQIETTPLNGNSGDTFYPQGFALPHETSKTYDSPS